MQQAQRPHIRTLWRSNARKLLLLAAFAIVILGGLTCITSVHGQVNDVVCDNRDSCFRSIPSASIDTWGVVTPDATPDTYADHAYWTLGESQAIDKGRWTMNLPLDGYYDVDVWYPSFDGIYPRTGSAHYSVHSLDGDRSVKWDQTSNAGRWNEI